MCSRRSFSQIPLFGQHQLIVAVGASPVPLHLLLLIDSHIVYLEPRREGSRGRIPAGIAADGKIQDYLVGVTEWIRPVRIEGVDNAAERYCLEGRPWPAPRSRQATETRQSPCRSHCCFARCLPSIASGTFNGQRWVGLFFKDFFDVANLFLNLTSHLFVVALSFQAGIVRDAPHFFFDRAFRFVPGALNLIFCAVFHLIAPSAVVLSTRMPVFPSGLP